MSAVRDRPDERSRAGSLPVSALAPLDYRYALDAAMPRLAAAGSPLVRCQIPQLEDEARQRIPGGHNTDVATAGLWLEPLRDSWRRDLNDLEQGLQPGAVLVLIASRPLARLLPERRAWPGRPLGLEPGGIGRLLRALREAGFMVEADYGIHSPASIGLNRAGRLLQRLGRPDLRDRLQFAGQLRYCTGGRLRGAATVALLFAHYRPAGLRSEQALFVEPGSESGDEAAGSSPSIVGGPPHSRPAAEASRASVAVSRVDAWLDTMRCPGGYGGPVAHWWQQSLLYVGPALDWRYEGIIAGYLELWRRTGSESWLAKARRAGDDLVAGQLQNGHFAASAFELNPAAAGTPHEAACDVGLLLLARAVRESGSSDWESYAACAERNLRAFYIGQLWDGKSRSFADSPIVPTFVPNKAATACEALFLLAEISGDERWVEQYALPTLDRILEHQVADTGRLDGAIAQNTFRGRRVDKYFPIYIARCIPALLEGYCWTNDGHYAESAGRAMRFIAGQIREDGSLPTVVYPDGHANRYPSWVAALGDILRAADELRPYGCDHHLSASKERLLAGQDESGGIRTASGFATQAGGPRPEEPDVRDLLHVAGWCDKAFRYLAAHVDSELPEAAGEPFEAACSFRGQTLRLLETPQKLEVSQNGSVCYRWCKGQSWPELATEAFWLR